MRFGINRVLFVCNNRAVSIADLIFLSLVSLIYIVPFVFFMLFYYKEVLQVMPLWYVCFGFILLVLSFVFWILTSLTEPGIVARGSAPKDAFCDADKFNLVRHPNNNDIILGRTLTENGKIVFQKYCYTCEVFRPPRCSHCSMCDNCVIEFDHHCQFVSNCIGRKNLKFFLSFIFSTSALCLFSSFAMACLNLKHMNSLSDFDSLLSRNIGFRFFFFVFLFAIGCVLFGFSIYHIVLACKGLTTNEHIKWKRDPELRNEPERLSGIHNFKRIFFTSVPSSQFTES